MPDRPRYVPVNAHYVNPPGTEPLPRWVPWAALVAVLVALSFVVAFLWLGLVADPGHRPAPQPTVTPTTYGPPPS